MTPTIFLSHQGADAQVAEALAELLSKALGLKRAEIRCTTPEGSKLPIGSEIGSTLEREVIATPVFVCLVTKKAAKSRFVRLEIAARLKSGKQVFPVLGVGARLGLIPEIQNAVALRCNDRKDLLQLVDDISKKLGIKLQPPQYFDAAVEAVLKATPPPTQPRWPMALGMMLILTAGGAYWGPGWLHAYRAQRASVAVGSTLQHATEAPEPTQPPEPSATSRPPAPRPPPRTVAELREANGARVEAAARASPGTPDALKVNEMPAGSYGYAHAESIPDLDRAVLWTEKNDRTYEVHRTAAGNFVLVGYVSEASNAALGTGRAVTLPMRPAPYLSRWVLVSIPFERIASAAPKEDGGGPFHSLTLHPAPPRGHE